MDGLAGVRITWPIPATGREFRVLFAQTEQDQRIYVGPVFLERTARWRRVKNF